MTKLDEELERLSKAAEQGLITILPGANSHCFDGRLMLGNKCIAFVEGDQTQDEDGEYQIVLDPEALLIVELWNAYRTGQLVPAQPSEPDRYPLNACVWKRQPYDGCSEGEWVLEIEGAINDTSFVARHIEPLATPPEEVPGLPSLYPARPSASCPSPDGCGYCKEHGCPRAQPSGDVVEAVGMAIMDHRSAMQPGLQWAIESEDNRDWYRGLARAAITTYEAVSGVAKMREASKTFAQMMEGWGPEYFPARIVTDYESTASAYDIRWEDIEALRAALGEKL